MSTIPFGIKITDPDNTRLVSFYRYEHRRDENEYRALLSISVTSGELA